MSDQQQRQQQHGIQYGLTPVAPLREGEKLMFLNGQICRQNEQAAWIPYHGDTRPIFHMGRLG